MLKDSSSYERQIIDAVRSVNKALGGTYGTSSAIYKNEFNQYEVQLIDAIKGIGRTLSGKGLSVVGGAGGVVDDAAFQSLSRRVTKLENESFFRLVDGNVTLKEDYQNLWVPGWLAAGGIGTGGGGDVSFLKELTDVHHDDTGILRSDGTAVQNGDVLVYDSENGIWNAAANSGGGGGSTVEVTSHATAAAQSLIATITVDGVATGIYNDVRWGTYDSSTHTIPVTINGTTRILCVDGYGGGSVTGYIGMTAVQSTSQQQALFGIASINATASASSSSRIIWDSANNAWHFIGNVYADGWIAAGGLGSGGGGGASTLSGLSDVSLSSLSNGQALVYRDGVWQNETISGGGSGGSGTVTSVGLSVPTGLSVSGSPITTSGTLRISLASGYKIPTTAELDNFVTLDTAQTITGAKTFSTNPLTIASSSGISVNAASYIDIGNARIIYDSGTNALHITKKSGTSGVVGLFADGFLAAGGISGQTTVQYVDLESDQVISGGKTFADYTEFSTAVSITAEDLTSGSALSVYGESRFYGIVQIGVTYGPTLTGTASLLSISKNTEFTYATGKTISISDIVSRIEALENA